VSPLVLPRSCTMSRSQRLAEPIVLPRCDRLVTSRDAIADLGQGQFPNPTTACVSLITRTDGATDRSSQIPTAARIVGINPSTRVQVAFVIIPRAGCGRRTRRRTPTAIGIGGVNPSVPVQVAAVVILAARLGVGGARVARHRDHSHRQRGQEPEHSKAHDASPYPARCASPVHRPSSARGRDCQDGKATVNESPPA
jgi:hypothetical protein